MFELVPWGNRMNRKTLESELERFRLLLDEERDLSDDLLKENARLREALEFYADKNTWSTAVYVRETGPYNITDCPIAYDAGAKAREALTPTKGGEE